MPYFAWRGVNLHAQICKGTQFARDTNDLDALLFKKDIALLECNPKKIWWKKNISLQNKIDYVSQLAMLTHAGMLLPHALQLVAGQANNNSFALVAHDVADQVEQGVSLPHALEKHATFGPLVVQMAAVGKESGSLPAALQVLAHHLESLAHFKGKLRAALLLPAVTFAFFIVIMSVLLIVIVPQFASILGSMQKELPGATKAMVIISNFLRSWNLLLVLIAGAIGYGAVRFYAKTAEGQQFISRLLMRVPFIQSLVINKTMAGFFHGIALLMHGGMPLVKAVHIAKESIDNQIIKSAIEQMHQEMQAGVTLADALAGYERLCGQDMISLIKVGQEAGQLPQMLGKIAELYQQRLIQKLSRINTFFQPFLLIILGLMITGLILALYAPIMSLSYAV